MKLSRDLLMPGIIREFLDGGSRDWTRGDWFAAILRFPVIDATTIMVHTLLDHTGALGRALTAEIMYRRAAAKAGTLGAELFCIYHDCDMDDCPAGSHD